MRYACSVLRFRLIFLCVSALGGSLSVAAASNLKWENTAVEVHAPPLAAQVDAVFRFTNVGQSRVAIVSIAASCGCTAPHIEKRVYAPGEKGELHALFTPDDRTGLRQEEVVVLTDEPGQAPQVLILRVTVPPLYVVSPYFVIWHGGEEPAVKTVKVHLLDSNLLQPVSIQSHDPRVIATFTKDAYSPTDYTVQIHPLSTQAPLDTTIRLELTGPKKAKRVLTLYAVVRTAPGTAANPSR